MLKAVAGTAVTLAVLGVGGYFADSAVRATAEDRVATALQQELDLSARPLVHLGGVPFSLALVTRSVPDASAEAAVVPLAMSGQQVELTDVRLTTGAIQLEDGQARIASARATAVLGYADLARVAGVPVAPAGNGRLELRYARDVLGRELTLAISVRPELDVEAALVRLTDPRLEVGGQSVDVNLSQAQLDAIVEPISVELEQGLRLTSIDPTGAGVGVAVAGEDLAVPLG